jgi:exocyst complex component 4
LISEKRLLQAAILLVRSLKIVRNADMMEIGAVTDLRNYLVSQEPVSISGIWSRISFNSLQALREILIDELHSHLYLKSVFTNSRWVAYTPNQQTRECNPRRISGKHSLIDNL